MIALRGLVRLVGFLLIVLLAVAGAATAVFCIQGGQATLSLPHLAELIRLSDLRDSVGELLYSVQADGPTAQMTALAGAASLLVGFAVLAGALVGRRERLLTIDDHQQGRLAARRRALAQMAVAQVEQSRGALRAKASIRPRRRGKGGRLRVTTFRPETISDEAAIQSAQKQLASFAEALSLRVRARAREPRRGSRRVG